MESPDNVRRLALDASVHGVINHLQDAISDISEIYVVVTDKSGSVHECMSGDVKGLTFAIAVLQRYAMKVMDEQRG